MSGTSIQGLRLAIAEHEHYVEQHNDGCLSAL